MKKHWGKLLLLVVIVLLAIGIWRGTAFFQESFDGLFAQSREVAATSDAAARAVSAAWQPEALRPFATPEYLTSLEGDGAASWASYRNLGAPTTIAPCTTSGLKITNGVGVAQTSCRASFGDTEASILFGFTNAGGDWKINSLRLLL